MSYHIKKRLKWALVAAFCLSHPVAQSAPVDLQFTWKRASQSRSCRYFHIPSEANKQACQAFEKVMADRVPPLPAKSQEAATSSSQPEGLATEGLVLVKDGQIMAEFYDSCLPGRAKNEGFSQNSPHPLWSQSKTLTSTLLAAAIQNGQTYRDPQGNEQPLSLKSPLTDFFPYEERHTRFARSNNSALPAASLAERRAYEQIRLKHLVEMSSGLVWDESYESGIKTSSFLPMLYIHEENNGGRNDMLSYALDWPLTCQGPGQLWNYSGGNSIILQGVLRKVYGEKRYQHLPWTLLFDRLGIDRKEARWEQDGSGLFVGSSYAMLTPRAMARIGSLYLNGGRWKNQQIIPATWVEEASKVSPTVNDPKSYTPMSLIKREGVFSQRTFWLNQSVTRPKKTRACGEPPPNNPEMETFPAEFPNSPKDMYFAAGHFGQLIVVIPSQNIVMTRTGSDAEYWSKVDSMVSLAVACYGQKKTTPETKKLIRRVLGQGDN